MPLSDQVVILATVRSYLGQKKREEIFARLRAALGRDVPREVVLYLKVVYLLTQEGYFDPPAPPELQAARATVTKLLDQQEAEDSRTYDSSTSESTSSDEADWEAMEERKMPNVNDKDYVSWIRVQLAGVDLHCTHKETEDWIKNGRTPTSRIDWDFEKKDEPSLKEFVKDILQEQLENGKLGAAEWIRTMREHRTQTLRNWQGQPGITEELVPPMQQRYRVTNWETGLLNRAETVRWMMSRMDPSINIRIHETRHWSLCTSDECLIHLMEKDEYDYWPQEGKKPDRTGRAPEGTRPRVWNSDFPTKTLLNGGILEKTLSGEHWGSDWRKCWYGTCQIHRDAKRTAGYWPKCPPEEDPVEALQTLANEQSDSGNE
jgi:hypothetical protein